MLRVVFLHPTAKKDYRREKIESANIRAGGEDGDYRCGDNPFVCALGVFFEGKTHGGEKYRCEGSE